MGINKRLHDVEVALGFAVDNTIKEDIEDNYGDVFDHTLYGIHITNTNNALSDDNPHICIGWSSLGDLTSINTKDELSDKYDEVYTKTKMGKAQDIGQIWRFIHEAQVGDYVILGESSKLHIGRIESSYYFDNTPNPQQDSDYVNNHKVKWLMKNIDRTLLSSSFHHSLGSAMSFFTLNDYKAAVVDLLNGNYKKDDDVVEDDSFIENVEDYDNCERLTGGENIILYGVPGAGKSWTIKHEYCSDDTCIERLVFHPDYTYSDFVGQIMPKVSEEGSVNYEFTPGPFTKLVRKAYLNPNKMFYLVIEEVNRGNAPAIFGDVFQLLDRQAKYIEDENKKLVENPDYGASEYEITNADLARSIYKEKYMKNGKGDKVSIPSNMSILCTMNTSDQNVFTLDTAFQRRWNMRLIENKFPDDGSEDDFAKMNILDTEVTWQTFFTSINTLILKKNIRMTSSEDKRLGTHFVSPSDLQFDNYEGPDKEKQKKANRQNRRFAEKVLKYLWDDAFKFNKDEIFDITKVNSLEQVIAKFVATKNNDRFVVIFKQNIIDDLIPKKQ